MSQVIEGSVAVSRAPGAGMGVSVSTTDIGGSVDVGRELSSLFMLTVTSGLVFIIVCF